MEGAMTTVGDRREIHIPEFVPVPNVDTSVQCRVLLRDESFENDVCYVPCALVRCVVAGSEGVDWDGASTS